MGRVLENNKKELLRRWLQGGTTSEEERQLRQWAKHDTFLAEAMEGYTAVKADDHVETIDRLRKQLTKGGRSKKIYAERSSATKSGGAKLLSFSNLAIAASVLVMLGVGTWLFIGNGDTKSALEQIADAAPTEKKEKESTIEMESAIEESDAIIASNDEVRITSGDAKGAVTNLEVGEVEVPKPNPSAPIALNEVKKENPEVSNPDDENIEAGFEEEDAREGRVVENLSTLSSGATAPIANSTNEEIVAEKMDEINNPRPVVGYVVSSESGEPLGGAKIFLDNTDESVFTDRSGRFQVMVDENISRLRVTHMGYSQTMVPLSQQDSSLTISLEEQGLLADAVAVPSARSKSKSQTKRESSSRTLEEITSANYSIDKSSAEPKGGYRKFNKYITKNLNFPASAKSNNIKGQVILKFDVNQKGLLENIKVVKGLGHGCDEEAIRLLQNGPLWKNKTPYPSITTSVIVTFE